MRVLAISLLVLLPRVVLLAQESPYFVTYNHHLEEPGDLELEASTTTDIPRAGQKFYVAPWTEFEYGVTARWTAELYLEAQSAWPDSTLFTGWRIENRFRPLKREHLINPVLYLEYENLNEASRIQKEIVGGGPDLTSPNAELRRTPAHELETKLILSSELHDWNLSENFIVEKNLSKGEGFEFGYALGFSRPLATLASGSNCRVCRENFFVGMEFYGGLGSTLGFGPGGTPHYAAPVVAWLVNDNTTLRFSPGFGLTHESCPVLFRLGMTYEIQGAANRLSRLFRGK
jgi:hypothetical protein